MKYEVCPNCGAHLDHGERCDCMKKQADKKPCESAGEYADKPATEAPKTTPNIMPGA